MREELERNLASKIEPSIVADILSAYEGLIQKHRALDAEGALTRAGKFVEHVFRALEIFAKSPLRRSRKLGHGSAEL